MHYCFIYCTIFRKKILHYCINERNSEKIFFSKSVKNDEEKHVFRRQKKQTQIIMA